MWCHICTGCPNGMLCWPTNICLLLLIALLYLLWMICDFKGDHSRLFNEWRVRIHWAGVGLLNIVRLANDVISVTKRLDHLLNIWQFHNNKKLPNGIQIWKSLQNTNKPSKNFQNHVTSNVIVYPTPPPPQSTKVEINHSVDNLINALRS